MKLTLAEIIDAADLVAKAIWVASHGPTSFGWRDALGRMRADALAQFVVAQPTAAADALYRFATADEPGAARWRDIPPQLRVATEVFRATFLALYREMQAATCAAASGTPPAAKRVTVLDASATPLRLRRVPQVVPRNVRQAGGDFEAEVAAIEGGWRDDDGRPRRKGRRP